MYIIAVVQTYWTVALHISVELTSFPTLNAYTNMYGEKRLNTYFNSMLVHNYN